MLVGYTWGRRNRGFVACRVGVVRMQFSALQRGQGKLGNVFVFINFQVSERCQLCMCVCVCTQFLYSHV